MTRIISKESVRRANYCLRQNSVQNTNTNSNVYVSKVITNFGSKEFVVSKEQLNTAAKTAMRNMKNE